MENLISMKYLVGSVVYSFLGLLVFWAGFYVIDRFTPVQLWKEIIDEHNTALAIIVGSLAIGIALIISSAIHG